LRLKESTLDIHALQGDFCAWLEAIGGHSSIDDIEGILSIGEGESQDLILGVPFDRAMFYLAFYSDGAAKGRITLRLQLGNGEVITAAMAERHVAQEASYQGYRCQPRDSELLLPRHVHPHPSTRRDVCKLSISLHRFKVSPDLEFLRWFHGII